ncbi:BQ5605_C013g07120 [Microbotryum silenes-dioicae]|uniref:BQ5605_C013g07120 protein n=1 Tax=Microbotryum silenes-dioicae TaxID=796604 RepID=A0A2X0LUB4_9BASI|nr:BQ5605_C013g07120 [Microbotryum silenes-dioicae]
MWACFSASLVTVTCAALASAHDPFSRSTIRHSRRYSLLPDTYILETECPDASILAEASPRTSGANMDSLVTEVLAAFPDARPRHVYDSALFCGLSVELGADSPHTQLLRIQRLKSVSPVRSIQLGVRTAGSSDTPFQAEASLNVVPRTEARGESDYLSSHVMLEVDKMHEMGLFGSRETLACVIDSGIDLMHPLLGNGCFGSNCKVVTGYDFVGDDGHSPKRSPQTSCSDHGTHIAGILAADKFKAFGFSGVAPNASLGVYRVFSCKGAASSDTFLKAMLMAADDGCRVLSLSFGKALGWDQDDGDDPFQKVVSRLATRGVFIAAASGNDASQGLMFAQTPADLAGILAVGSVEPVAAPRGFKLSFEHNRYPSMTYLALRPVNHSQTFQIHFHSIRRAKDTSCDPLLPRSSNFTNSVVVLQKGACGTKLIHFFVRHGARVVIAHDNGDPEQAQNWRRTAYAVHSQEGLEWLLKWPTSAVHTLLDHYLDSLGDLQVNFRSKDPVPQDELIDRVAGGLVSEYTEFGPAATLDTLAAHVSAPGSSILSTFPLNKGGYGVASGTSMATPMAAGVATLLISHRKDDHLTPAQIRSLMITTAGPVATKLNSVHPLTTVMQQGGGLVSAHRAYHAMTLIWPYALALYDTPRHVKDHVVTLTNTHKSVVTYSFNSVPSQTLAMYNKSAATEFNPSRASPIIQGSATVSFDPRQLTIAAGQKASFKVSIEQPAFSPSDLARYPTYGGWVVIHAQGDLVGTYRIPYFGIVGVLQQVPILDRSDYMTRGREKYAGLSYPFLVVGNNTGSGSGGTKHLSSPLDHKKSGVVSVSRARGLDVIYRLAMPTDRIYFDVIHAASSTASSHNASTARPHRVYPIRSSEPEPWTTVGPRETSLGSRFIGNWIWFSGLPRNTDEFAQEPVIDSNMGTFYGQLASSYGADAPYDIRLGSNVPVRFLVRALRLGATDNPEDYENQGVYDTWTSDPFEFID